MDNINNDNINNNENNEMEEVVSSTDVIVPSKRPKISDDELYGYNAYSSDKIERNNVFVSKEPEATTYGVLFKLNCFVNFVEWPRAR